MNGWVLALGVVGGMIGIRYGSLWVGEGLARWVERQEPDPYRYDPDRIVKTDPYAAAKMDLLGMWLLGLLCGGGLGWFCAVWIGKELL